MQNHTEYCLCQISSSQRLELTTKVFTMLVYGKKSAVGANLKSRIHNSKFGSGFAALCITQIYIRFAKIN